MSDHLKINCDYQAWGNLIGNCNWLKLITWTQIIVIIISRCNVNCNHNQLHCKWNHNQWLLSWLHKVFDYLPCYVMEKHLHYHSLRAENFLWIHRFQSFSSKNYPKTIWLQREGPSPPFNPPQSLCDCFQFLDIIHSQACRLEKALFCSINPVPTWNEFINCIFVMPYMVCLVTKCIFPKYLNDVIANYKIMDLNGILEVLWIWGVYQYHESV